MSDDEEDEGKKMNKFEVGDIVTTTECTVGNQYKIVGVFMSNTNNKYSLQFICHKDGYKTDFGYVYNDVDESLLVLLHSESSIPIKVCKATVLLDNGTDLIILATNLPSPMPCIDSGSAKLELRTQKDCGIEYVRKNFGLEPEILSNRMS
jgi:hypothetical protein